MAPFLLPLLSGLGSIFGGAAKGASDQRQSENSQTAQQNALLAQLYNTRQNATTGANLAQSREQSDHAGIDMDRKKFALGAPSVRAGQSVRGSILQNAQPASISGLPSRINVPQISGGLTPAMFSGDTRALGGEMTRKALIDQLKGDTFDPLQKTDFAGGVLAPPQMENYQKSGLLEQILGGLGLGASVGSGVLGAIKHSNKRPPIEMDIPAGAG
jgi:hypothetical protein